MAAWNAVAGRWVSREMVLLFVVMATLPLWIGPVGLYQYLGIEIAIWMIYGLGYNLLLGYSGLPNFGHGAYAFGLFQLRAFESLWLGMACAIVAPAVAGAFLAYFLLHRRGIYFVLVVLAVVTLLLWRLVHSPFGKVLQATRQNEERARFVGYNVWLFKWAAFTLSAAIAGLAGSRFSMAQQSAYPDVMSLHASGIIVMMTLIGGGFVSFWGPVIGVAVYFVARDVLGTLTETWLLWFGLVFVLAVIFKPEGIAGA